MPGEEIPSDQSFMAPSSCFGRERFGGWCMSPVGGIRKWGMFLLGGILEPVHVASCMITSWSVIHAWEFMWGRDIGAAKKTPSDFYNDMYLLACITEVCPGICT